MTHIQYFFGKHRQGGKHIKTLSFFIAHSKYQINHNAFHHSNNSPSSFECWSFSKYWNKRRAPSINHGPLSFSFVFRNLSKETPDPRYWD